MEPVTDGGESVRGTGDSVMEVRGDAHARLPLHRSGLTVNDRNTLLVGVRTVVEDDVVDGAGNAAGKLAEGVLRGSWRWNDVVGVFIFIAMAGRIAQPRPHLYAPWGS